MHLPDTICVDLALLNSKSAFVSVIRERAKNGDHPHSYAEMHGKVAIVRYRDGRWIPLPMERRPPRVA